MKKPIINTKMQYKKMTLNYSLITLNYMVITNTST